MTGIRVTDEAVNAAIQAAGWSWMAEPEGYVPSPEECMRPILEAAAEHLTDDRVAAALKLHERRQATPSTGPYCALDSSNWPCRTARALGIEP